MISLATLTALATYRAARTPLSDRKSVLVIDYNPPIRELLALTLGQAGYRVTTVDGGQAALTWIEDALRSGVSPALVLLDLSIPWDRRLEILHQVRAQWDTGPCPVPRILILTTQRLPLAQLEGCRVIRKPFRLRELLREVEDVLPFPLPPERR